MIQASFTVTPTAGDVYATSFAFVNTTTSTAAIRHLAWDFGDNSSYVYDVQRPAYIYQYPGTYTVSITSANILGETSIFRKNISVDYAYRDYVLFTEIPDQYANPGKKTNTPFKVQVLTTQIDKPINLNLFCTNSNSIPYEHVPERWSFLNPTWRFTNLQGTTITSLSVLGRPVFKNKRVVALSGEAQFYFIDSTSTGAPGINCPLILTCSLETSGVSHPLESDVYPYPTYANNKSVKGALVWYVNNIQPNLLKVTSNYLNNMYSQYWENVKVPFLITAHYNRALELSGALNNVSDIVFSYPQTNAIGLYAPVSATVTKLTPSQYTLDDAPLYFQATDKNNYRTSGYIFTTFTPEQTSTNSVIQASATITPYSLFQEQLNSAQPNPFVYISNPEQNTINKITLAPVTNNCTVLNYYKNLNILGTGYTTQIPVPAIYSNNTFNYNMSGFSGIYSIAIDPRDYSFLACDAELERIYKFTSSGSLLKTFQLSSLERPVGKAYQLWRFTTTTPLVSTYSYFLDGTVQLSNNKSNYIVSVGGIIQIPSNFIIDTESRTIRFLTTLTDNIPQPGTEINVVQIFNPDLPPSYISTLTTWVTSTPNAVNSFYLTGTTTLSANSKYYLVAVDGVLQSPTTYTINTSTRTINFSSPIPSNITIQTTFLPKLDSPATWSYNLTTLTNTLPLTGDPNYIPELNTYFLVNIGGVFQPAVNFIHDFNNDRLIFNDPLPTNIPIIVTQISIPDDIPDVTKVLGNFTPSSITIDKNYNFWVTFFNNLRVIKFDQNFNILFTKIPDLSSADNFLIDGDYLLKPAVAETDSENNCWVTYAHPLCSFLTKYDSNGRVLTQIPLNDYSVPVSLAVDLNDNVWVANITNVLSAAGNIQLFNNTNYTLIKSITGIPRPSYLAVDNNNNLWFTHSLNGLGYYNLTTDTLRTWSINNNQATLINSIFALTSVPDIFINDEEIGGLGIDSFNRVWIINSYTNTANVIANASPTFVNSDIYTFAIRPKNTIGYYVDLDTGATITESLPTYNYRSAQASGDWTGIKWYQKYTLFNNKPRIIKGQSTPFNITEFSNKNEIRRINESFNTTQYYESLALPEILKNNQFLWNKFFAAAVGTAELSANEDLGQITYERIGNFLNNHADIDTCNIDQLLSLAKQTNVAAAEYVTDLPAEIKRFLDIASIYKNKLFGLKDNEPILKNSLGSELNPYTTILTPGEKIILKSKLDKSISLVIIPQQNNTNNTYPLSTLHMPGFAIPHIEYYQFFEFVPNYTKNYIENIIDWDSPFTTLNPTISTFEQWYGENGVLETTFNYLLTKNLILK